MEINLKLDKDFTRMLDYLGDKYGEEFEKINGFADANLNLSSFIDAFIDSDNNADATIDANANVQTKDVSNLVNEIPKPFLKLLGFSKVFYEAKKKYGLDFAKKMLEAEWRKDIFIHNASDISLRPYSYSPNEWIDIIYKGERKHLTFEALYDLVDETEEYVKEHEQWVKTPKDLFIDDIIDGKATLTPVIKVMKHINHCAMRHLILEEGLEQIITENHPVITKNGDKHCSQLTKDDIIPTTFGDLKVCSANLSCDYCPVVYDITTETGHFICNNILSHNCFNYDLVDLATKGMFFIGNLKTGPAKHLSTFADHVLEFISWVSNRQSGASGIANVLMWFYWFWINDVKNNHYLKSPEYYRDQTFQKVSKIA